MGYGLLIINEDSTCRKMVSEVLRVCDHRELHTGKLLDCLGAIWNIKDTIEPVLMTNIHRLREKGPMLIPRIRNLFGFEIVQMTPDDAVIGWKRGRPINASAHVLNISSIEKMNSLWKFAKRTSKQELKPADLFASSNREMVEQQIKKLLLSKKEGRSSSKTTAVPSDSAKLESYHGLSLAGDGKSLKYGQSGSSGNSKIQTQTSPSAATPGTEVPFRSNPLTSGKPPNTLPQNSSHQSEVSDYCPSIFSDHCSTFDQELVYVLKDTEAHCPSQPVDGTIQQYQALPYPLLGTSGGDTSGQESSTSSSHVPRPEALPPQMPQMEHEVDSFKLAEDINAFLNETGSSASRFFWERVYDYARITTDVK